VSLAHAVIIALIASCGTTDTTPPPGTSDEPGTEDSPVADCVTDAEFFAADAAPLLASRCMGCHVEGGLAEDSANVLSGEDDTDWLMLAELVAGEGGATLLLEKPTGLMSHGGGEVIDLVSDEGIVLQELVARLEAPGGCENPGESVVCEGAPRPGPTPRLRLTDAQYANAVSDLFGVEVDPSNLPETTRNLDSRRFSSNNPVSSAGAENLLIASETVTAAIDFAELTGCTETDEDCTRDALLSLAEQIWRRPLDADEQALVTAPLDTGLAPFEAAALSIQVMLNAPQFLYLDARPGADVAHTDALAHLDDHAVAARLSFFLVDTTPDAELRAAAAAGELHTREQIQAQAERLAQDPRALRAVAAFHEDWLDLSRLDEATRDADAYPAFDEDLVSSMRTEADLFVTEVVWGGEATFDVLMQSRTTWVDSDLAALYGLEDPGEGWHRVTLDETRPGALTRTGFLSAHAYSASSAPVKRGYFVLKDLLCEELAVPPDVDMVIDEDDGSGGTIRDRLEAHQTDSSCAGCHVRIDPIGLGFEHYDALGSWRDTWEDGTPVDASGELDGVAFEEVTELLAHLATRSEAQACYATRWYEHALGRPAELEDVCTLDTLHSRFEASGGDIRALLVDIAMSDAFVYLEEGP